MKIQPEQLKNPGFTGGIGASIKAMFYALTSPSLLFYLFVALVINSIVIGGMVWGAWIGMDAFTAWSIQKLGDQSFLVTFLKWFSQDGANVQTFLKAGLFAVILYFILPPLFALMLNLNPISGYLAGRMFQIVFQKETGKPMEEVDGLITGLSKMLWSELCKLVLMVVFMVLAFACNLIPVVGSIAAFILLPLISIHFTGWSYVTPYYESLGYGFSSQRRAARRQNTTIWGLGLISVVPFLNIVAIFFGPIAGALVMAEVHKSQ